MNWKFDFSPETSATFMLVSVGSSRLRRSSVFDAKGNFESFCGTYT